MARETESNRTLSGSSLVERVQSILINAAEGQRSVGDDCNYTGLRKEMQRRFPRPPELVSTHPDVNSFAAYIKGINDRRERVDRVRKDFSPLLRQLGDAAKVEVESADWTGIEGRGAKLATARQLLPLAQAAVESMIASLSEPGPNGGPLLDGRDTAIDHLRQLHTTIGDLMIAIDGGHFDDDLGQGLAAEASRYAKRAAHALRDDPIPYLSSALLLGIFSACGLPGIGGYISGVAMAVRKSAARA